MKTLEHRSSILDTVYVAIRDAICDGELEPGARVTQEEIAEQLGVSRQPVVQAFVLLKSQGFFREAGRRGLIVAPVGTEQVRNVYEVRASLDETAARLAAERARADDLAEAWDIVEEGERLVEHGNVRDLVRCDMAFHEYVYGLSGNPLIRPALEPHLHQMRRVMMAVVEPVSTRARLWREHRAILQAIADQETAQAGSVARAHVETASVDIQARIRAETPGQGTGAGHLPERKRDERSGSGTHPGDARQDRA